MNKLIIHKNGIIKETEFTAPEKLGVLLEKAGVSLARPCGGLGKCGKCEVTVDGEFSKPNDAEKRAGKRLACQITVCGDGEVFLPDKESGFYAETDGYDYFGKQNAGDKKLGIAIDIGTTAVAAALCDLENGIRLSTAGMLNPQTNISADVMGRIGFSVSGGTDILKDKINSAISEITADLCKNANKKESQIDSSVICGNTAMLYFLTGKNASSLSAFPFTADDFFGRYVQIGSLNAYLPRCMHAFVGADITSSVLASGMTEKDETSLLCDIGTNGETALWHNGTLYVTSTAAGPAFEGAGISCGCASVLGAIEHVWEENGQIKFSAISGKKPIGICGSGIIDVTAVLLRLGKISPAGSADGDLTVCEGVTFTRSDIRAVQLAKSAVATGIEMLVKYAGITYGDIAKLYISGGFGSHIDIKNAAEIGLLPIELISKVKYIGNGALSGCVRMLSDKSEIEKAEKITEKSKYINLSEQSEFNDIFVENMFFGHYEQEY